MSDIFKTKGSLSAYFFEFKGDDENSTECCVLTVSEVRDNGEIEIYWQIGKMGRYLDFRWTDLIRAVKEAKKEEED